MFQKHIWPSSVKNLFFISVVFFVLYVLIQGFLFGHLKKNSDIKIENVFPFHTNCENPRYGSISIASYLMVHNKFSDSLGILNNPRPASEQQLKYLHGYFHFGTNSNLKVIPLGVKTINILQTLKTKYNKDLTYEYNDYSPSYYSGLIKSPFEIKSTDEALKITYTAELNLLLCGTNSDNNFSIDVTLPIDPYLAYWYVPASERIRITDGFLEKTINPCTSERFLSINYPPNFWYTWQPHKKGLSLSNEPYNCTQLLKDKKDVVDITANFIQNQKEKKSITYDFLKSRKEIDVSVIFGLNQETPKIDAVEKINAFLSENIDNFFETHENKNRADVLKQSQKIDGSLASFFYFFQNIKQIAELKTFNKKYYGTYVKFETQLILHQSKKIINLSVYLGHSDVDKNFIATKNFIKYLFEDFQNKQFIFNVSHSRHGKSMNLHAMSTFMGYSDQELKKILNTQEFQFLGVLSCFSTAYHSEEFFALRSQKYSDLLLMGSESYAFMAPLAILEYLDNSIYGENQPLIFYFKKYANLNDNYILERKLFSQ